MAISASFHIYNVQTKGIQHKSMVKSINNMVALPGQFIALQTFNALKEKFWDKLWKINLIYLISKE